MSEPAMRQWMCLNCGWTYDQAVGDPAGGIAPGTAWDDIPDTWRCPDCGAAKSEFDMVEI
jgi:rubredoxin